MVVGLLLLVDVPLIGICLHCWGRPVVRTSAGRAQVHRLACAFALALLLLLLLLPGLAPSHALALGALLITAEDGGLGAVPLREEILINPSLYSLPLVTTSWLAMVSAPFRMLAPDRIRRAMR